MARDPSISQDQVTRAAEAIRDTGVRPTARAIRDQLGSGSMATVLKYLRAWQDAQVRPAESPVALPQALQRSLLDFVAGEVERSRSQLGEDLAAANQANADLILECERNALTIENLTSALETVHGEKAELAGRLGQVEAERDVAHDAAAAERQAAETARTELAKALLRLEAMPRLQGDFDDLKAQLDVDREARVSAERAAAVAEARLDAAVAARDTAEKALADAKKRDEHAAAELSALRVELRQTQVALQENLAKAATSKPRARGSLPVPQTRKKKNE